MKEGRDGQEEEQEPGQEKGSDVANVDFLADVHGSGPDEQT